MNTSLSDYWVDLTSVTITHGVDNFLNFAIDSGITSPGDYILYFSVSMDIFDNNVDSQTDLEIVFNASSCEFADGTQAGETVHPTLALQTRQNDFIIETTGESLYSGHSCDNELYAIHYEDDSGTIIG